MVQVTWHGHAAGLCLPLWARGLCSKRRLCCSHSLGSGQGAPGGGCVMWGLGECVRTRRAVSVRPLLLLLLVLVLVLVLVLARTSRGPPLVVVVLHLLGMLCMLVLRGACATIPPVPLPPAPTFHASVRLQWLHVLLL